MKTLITGGAGFIGSHLARALLEAGHDVFVLDDLSTGSIDNIEPLKTRPRFDYAIDTITNEPVLAEHIDRCDVVFHLAAAVGVQLIVEAPVHTIETNVAGTEVVLKHASKKRKLVVITSTSEIYGKSTAIPFQEDADLVLGSTRQHGWAYACSKAIDEFLALAYWKERRLPIIILRLFNTVGPRQTGRYGMVIPNFVRQALAGDPITVFGTGTQSRSFGYVGDVVWGIMALAAEPWAVGDVFNLGDNHEITIRELATLVKTMTESDSEIVTIQYEEAYESGFEDMPRRVPDLTKVKNLVGYEPRVQLPEILIRVIEHHRVQLKEIGLAIPGASPAAFDRRCIPSDDVAPRSVGAAVFSLIAPCTGPARHRSRRVSVRRRTSTTDREASSFSTNCLVSPGPGPGPRAPDSAASECLS